MMEAFQEVLRALGIVTGFVLVALIVGALIELLGMLGERGLRNLFPGEDEE